tara:strand:- start:590 stop:802 length:213 start_codon:yes stop_codon:yes gene_type:complete
MLHDSIMDPKEQDNLDKFIGQISDPDVMAVLGEANDLGLLDNLVFNTETGHVEDTRDQTDGTVRKQRRKS